MSDCGENNERLKQLIEENARLVSENAKLLHDNEQIRRESHDIMAAMFRSIDSDHGDEELLENLQTIWNDLQTRQLFLSNPPFVKRFLSGFVDVNCLPKSIRSDKFIVDMLVQTKHFSKQLDVDVFTRFPHLREHAGFWMDQMRNHSLSAVADSFVETAREIPALRTNRELIEWAHTHALGFFDQPAFRRHKGNSVEILELFEAKCQEERESFLIDAMGRDWKTICVVPHEMQLRFPTEVGRYTTSRRKEEVVPFLAPNLWNNRSFLLEWFPFDCCYQRPPDNIVLPDDIRNDTDFWWNLAKRGYSWAFRDHCPKSFLQDKEFMRRAIQVAGVFSEVSTLYALCPDGLRSDKTIVLEVVATAASLESYFHILEEILPREWMDDHDVKIFGLGLAKGRECRDFRVKLAKMKADCLPRAMSRVQAHNTFHETVLLGMSTFASDECTLKMLLVDPDTTLAIKRRLAEYLDVPCTMKEIEWLKHLERNGDNMDN